MCDRIFERHAHYPAWMHSRWWPIRSRNRAVFTMAKLNAAADLGAANRRRIRAGLYGRYRA